MTSKITQLNTLPNKLSVLGTFIRKIRIKKKMTLEHLAQAAFLKTETVRRIEAGRCLPISDDSFRIIEKELGLKSNVLVDKVLEHRKHLVEFIELYHDQLIAVIDALRIYSPDEVDRILNETKFKWSNLARKEGDIKMATSRRTTTAAKPAVKAAPKRAAKPAVKATPMKRSTASTRSTASRSTTSKRSK